MTELSEPPHGGPDPTAPAPSPHPLLLGSASGPAGVPTTDTGRLLLATDWAATALGPMAQWPQSLRIAVSICLNSRFPMFVWWGPQHVNIYNDAYVPVLGQRHPQAFGRPAREWWGEIWGVLAPQVEQVMAHGQASWNERVLLVMERNGFPEDTYFTWSYSPIYDSDGSIGGLFCACSEETARVAAERERDRLVRDAQDAARTLQLWFDSAPGFVALLRGPQFEFELANEAYRRLVGQRALEGRSVDDALPEVRDQGFVQLLRQVYDSGEPFVGRAVRVLLQPDLQSPASEHFVDFVYQPVRDGSGAVTGIFVQGHDVTEQVRGERALREADRRKDEFLATLAHELRNPLAPIRQAAQVAKSGRADARRQAWALDVIERQVGHMALLLDDLLDVSRISRGKLELRLEQIDLHGVVDAAVETVRPALDARRHELRLQLPPQPLTLLADPVRLAQVLSNLLSNAAKYTDPGGRITLAAEARGEQLVLRVRDTGIGLTPEARVGLFQMFSQVASALHRAEGGLGIGLALSRGLVELHGGRIQAESAGPGQGSEFIVTLPRRLGPAAAGDAPAAPAAASPSRRSLTVLLADDNADALETMAILLELEGHRVQTATDGAEALAQAEALRPAVVILDIGMPGLTGYEVAERIRASHWGGDMLLIALTGWGQPQDVERAHAAGFDQHCTKPVDVGLLLELVQRPRG